MFDVINRQGAGHCTTCSEITCKEVEVPDNGKCTSYCTPQNGNCTLGSKVCTAFKCNDGYVKEGNSCVPDITDLQELCVLSGETISGYNNYMRQKYNFSAYNVPECGQILPMQSGIYCLDGPDSTDLFVGKKKSKGAYVLYNKFEEREETHNLYFVGRYGETFPTCGNGAEGTGNCDEYDTWLYVEDYFVPTLILNEPSENLNLSTPSGSTCEKLKVVDGAYTNLSKVLQCRMSACEKRNNNLLKNKGLDSRFKDYFSGTPIY